MTYQEACSLFNVKATRRQATKWKNSQGRAYKLAIGLDTRITSRREENMRADEANTQIAVQNRVIKEFNKDLEEDSDDLKELIPCIPKVPLFEQFEVNMILGQ